MGCYVGIFIFAFVSIWKRCLLMEDTLGDALHGTPGPLCTLPFVIFMVYFYFFCL